MSERTVNERQLEVLKWVVVGCPDGVMSGTTHKTTAVALQNRRLATVSKRKGVWRAEATDAGRYFLEHGSYPPGHWSASPASTPAGATGSPPMPAAGPGFSTRDCSASTAATERDRPSPIDHPPRTGRRVTGLRPVDQLMADLAEAGGRVTVETDAGGRWENLVASAIRYGKVPDGKVLKIARGRDWNARTIWLEDPPAWMTTALDPIPVLSTLRSPHPVVRALRDDNNRLRMSREVRSRALRILDPIAKSATSRGYGVVSPPPEPGYQHPKGHLTVQVGRHPFSVVIDELNDRVPHEPTAKELRDKERYSWARIPSHDHVPSGRLRINIQRGWHVRQDSFSDTKTINLDDRLPVVLQEIELRAAQAEDRERVRERERLERQRQWEQVRDEAIIGAREHHRAEILAGQVDAWHEARRLDAYLEALESKIERLRADREPEEAWSAAREWLDWARAHRRHVDPLEKPLRLPADPEFKPGVIAPFMRGLSPHGPSQY